VPCIASNASCCIRHLTFLCHPLIHVLNEAVFPFMVYGPSDRCTNLLITLSLQCLVDFESLLERVVYICNPVFFLLVTLFVTAPYMNAEKEFVIYRYVTLVD
jgi:hypothetical protein